MIPQSDEVRTAAARVRRRAELARRRAAIRRHRTRMYAFAAALVGMGLVSMVTMAIAVGGIG